MKAAARRRVAGEQRSQNIDAENEQGEPDQALGDAIDAMRQRELKHDDYASEGRYRGGVSQGIEQTEAHPSPAIGLNAGDVGDGRDVVVVEAMTEPEDGRR